MDYREARTEWNDYWNKYIEDNVEESDRHLFSEGGFHNEAWYGYAESKFKEIADLQSRLTTATGNLSEIKYLVTVIKKMVRLNKINPDEIYTRLCDLDTLLKPTPPTKKDENE